MTRVIAVLLIGGCLLAASRLCTPATAQQVGVFSVFGDVYLPDGATPSPHADVVHVENDDTGIALAATVGDLEEGKYGVTFVDYAENRAAAVGDVLRLTLVAGSGDTLCVLPPHVVTAMEIDAFGWRQTLPRPDGSGSILAGTVRDATGEPLPGMTIVATDVLTERVAGSIATDVTGFFMVGRLQFGGYRLEVDPAGSLLIGEYYDDVPSYDRSPANLQQVETIWVVPQQVVFGLDFELAMGGRFAGTVVDEADGSPLYYVPVVPFTFATRDTLRPSDSEPGGLHASVALPAGSYGALVPRLPGYAGEYYLEADSLGAIAFEVAVGQITTAIDFTIGRDPVTVEPGVAPRLRVELDPPSPNPFNPSTRIVFRTPLAAELALAIYDVEGRLVRVLAEAPFGAGAHTLSWDGRDAGGRPLPSGVFLIRLEATGAAGTTWRSSQATRTTRAVLVR